MQMLINKLYPLTSEEIYAKIIYSLFLTFMLIVIIKYLPGTNSEMPKQVQKDLQAFTNSPSIMHHGETASEIISEKKKDKMNQMGYGFPHFGT
jgi:hypothetical protein